MARTFFLLLFPVLLLFALLYASVDPQLVDIVKVSPPDSALSVLILMKERTDLPGLRRSFESSKATFRDRHLRTIVALKGKANATQGGMIRFLEGLVASGEVRQYRPYWLINAITARVMPGAIAKIAARDDVEIVYPERKILLPMRASSAPASAMPSGAEPNLGIIGADDLWHLGYTGKGALVCNLDSGVDESHPALSARWRGNNGFPPYECWFDPYNHSITPVDDDAAGGVTHGTGVMSIIVGSSGGDTVGVAPGAEWIAANAFEADDSGSETSTTGILIECLQWASDPDGDPSTIGDVPRVINNSWGTPDNGGMVCEDLLYEAIDAVELAGAALFFSAGNTGGRGASTIASPASRVASPVNAFAVGSVTSSLDISSFSSRGPSTCDGHTVKPEVVAPGSDIRMAMGSPNGGYHYMSGTSFSSPHAAGAAALLLGANPLLSSSEVKYAILNSARDLGEQGDDNTFGMGLIDLPAALGLIGDPSASFISIAGIDFGARSPAPGEVSDIIITLWNGGAAVTGLETELEAGDSLVSVLQSTSTYGDLPRGAERDNKGDPFLVQMNGGVTEGTAVHLRLILTWSGGSTDTLNFAIVAGDSPVGAYGDHDAGNVTFTITNFGQYGYYNGVEQKGNGFMFPRDGTNWLYHGGFLAAVGPDQVSDGTDGGESDWQVHAGGNLIFSTNGDIADQEGYATFDDGRASNPIGLQVFQRSLAYSDNPNDDYVIIAYLMINAGGMDSLTNLYAGLFFDWDLDSVHYDRNYVDWLPDHSLGYMWGEGFPQHVGVSMLSHTPTAYRAIDNPSYVYEGFSDADKYTFMSGGFAKTRGDTPGDWSQMLSVGPFTLAPLDTISVVYAVLGGDDFADLTRNADSARAKYEEIKDLLHLVIIPPSAPEPARPTISQNYPNPFVPSEARCTTIWYTVTSATDSLVDLPVSIKVYDVRGRLVKDFRDDLNPGSPQPQGEYALVWDGTDDRGNLLPSGIYLYRMELADSEITRKLVLINK